uniref:Apple domain-containing protein n=1 Tax=Parastrongyloides trichosuri TaxID=131310 RepID=A0A0N4Z4J1_PARTI
MKIIFLILFFITLIHNYVNGIQNVRIKECFKILSQAKIKSQKTAVCLQLCMNYKEAMSKKLVVKTLKETCNLVIDKNNNLIPSLKRDKDILKDSPIPMTCFEEFPGKVLIGVVDQLIKDIPNKEECVQTCINTKLVGEVACKAVMYYQKDQTCVLSSETRNTMPELFTNDDDSLYIENKCQKNDNSNTISPVIDKINIKVDSNIIFTTTLKPLTEKIISTTPKNDKIPQQQELSGYEAPDLSPSVAVTNNILSTTLKNTPVIDSSVIDTYNSAISATSSKPSMNVNNNDIKISDNYNLGITTQKTAMAIEGYNPLPMPSTIKPFIGVSSSDKISMNINDVQDKANNYRRFYKQKDEKIVITTGKGKDGCFVSVSLKKMSPDVIVKSSSLKQCLEMCKVCVDCIHGTSPCNIISFSTITSHCALSTNVGENFLYKPNMDVPILHFKKDNCFKN